MKYARLLLRTTKLSFVEVHRQLGLPDDTRRDTSRGFEGGRQMPPPAVVEALLVCCRREVSDQALMRHYEQTLRDLYTAAQHPTGPDVDPAGIIVELGTPAPPIGGQVGAQPPPNPPSRGNLWARVLGAFTTRPRRQMAVGAGTLIVMLAAAITWAAVTDDNPASAGSASTAVTGATSTSTPRAGSTSTPIDAPTDVEPTHARSAGATASSGAKATQPGANPTPSTAPAGGMSSCAHVDGSVDLGEVRRQCAALPLNIGSKIDLDSDAANWDVNKVAADTATDPYDTADLQLTSSGLGTVVRSSQLMTTTADPDFTTCTNETGVTNPVPLNDIASGNAFCVHTNDGRYAGLVICRIRTSQGKVTGIELQVTIWGRNGH